MTPILNGSSLFQAQCHIKSELIQLDIVHFITDFMVQPLEDHPTSLELIRQPSGVHGLHF